MFKLRIVLFLTLLSLNIMKNVQASSDPWIKAYEDSEVKIEIQNQVQILDQNTGRFVFRWTWAEPHLLKMTPGVYYQSRIEKTDINFQNRQYKTTESVKLFDRKGKEIQFDVVVSSKGWDEITQGSIMDIVYATALDIFKKQVATSNF